MAIVVMALVAAIKIIVVAARVIVIVCVCRSLGRCSPTRGVPSKRCVCVWVRVWCAKSVWLWVGA